MQTQYFFPFNYSEITQYTYNLFLHSVLIQSLAKVFTEKVGHKLKRNRGLGGVTAK